MRMKDRVVQWVRRFTDMPVVGVDISDWSIKYMKITGAGTPVFEAFGEEKIPEGVIAGGEIKREDELAGVLRELAKKERACFRGAGVVASLPEEKSFLRPIRLKKVKAQDLRNAIRWEMEAQIPLPADELVFDYELLSGSGRESGVTDAVITAFPRAVVDSYVRVLKSAGFAPAALELESQAIVRAILPDLASAPALAVIDMGRTRTSFIIVAGGGIVFTTTVAVGGALFEENIVAALGVGQEEAIRIKKEVGLAKSVEGGKVFSALIPAVGAFADELTRAIQSYQNHLAHIPGGSSDIRGILLSGGDANLFGLDTYLASVARIPCTRADSFAALRPDIGDAIPPIPYHMSLAYTAAIGLALRGSPALIHNS